MTRQAHRSALLLYQYIAGLCDTSTGLLLIVAPLWTLHLMGVTIPPRPLVFASFIGANVLSLGLTYLGPAILWPLSPRTAARWRGQWLFSAFIRSSLALFVLVQLAAGRMEIAWISVALTDGAFAIIQFTGLARGWLNLAD